VGADTSIVIDEKTFDLAGRLVSSQGAVVDPTVFSEEPGSANGLWERKTVYPGGAERIEVSYLDGTIKEIKGDTETTGNPVTLRKFDYGVTTAGERWTREIRVGVGGAVTEWTERYQNMLGQQIRTEYPDGTIESRTFNEKGQLVRVYRGPSPETTGSEVQITLFAYNDLGEQEYTVVDVAQSIDPETWDVENEKGGTARITKTTNEVVTDPDRLRSTTTIWTKDADANETETVQISERSVSGLESWQTAFGVTTHTITTLDGDGGKTVRTNRADDSYRIEISQDGRLQSAKEYDANDQQLEGVSYQYDEHGRVSEVIDERNGATEYTYFDDDQVETVTTPDPDSSRSEAGWIPQVITFEYDERGRQKTVIHPDNTETFTTYWPSGQVRRVSGSRTYPVEYTYDRQGRMLTMTTWQDYDVPGNEEGAVDAATTWSYDPNRGWLTEKKDSDLNKTVYGYDALGRLKTRAWERGPVTTYGYTTAGELNSIIYTGESIDAALRAADVDIQYDRRGLRESVTEIRGSTVVSARIFKYSDHWQLEEEEWTDGVLEGFTLQREYLDSLKRLTEIRLKQGASTILFQEIDYATGRPHIASVSDLTVPSVPVRADFTIEPDSRMIANTKFYHDQTLRFEVTRQRDALDRLGSISSSTASFTYDYNAADQRNKVITEDDQYWNWGYDDLGQLESATRHQSSGQKVLGHDFTFTHDTIGNRTQAVRNGTPSTYQPNLLNQYEERDVPGIVHILGMANPEATVTVEQQPTLRQDALFYSEFPVDNDPASVHESILIRGVKIEDGAQPENHVSDVERQVFVPATPESFAYDDDGNLIQDGRWNYVWNAENRLVRMETRTGLAATLVRQRLDFTYDSDGRRIRKSVLEWDNVSSNFVPVSSTRYLYNNWNLLAEIDETDSLIRSYLWGPSEHGQYDSTATPGALLGLRDHTDNNAFYFAQADGNGNIAILIAATDGSQAARYEYGPFGEPLRATGPMAQANPHRFSSKFADTETGLLYYGYRYYSPGMGRWLNRDPIGEMGGLNLFGFVGNDPVNKIDVLGLHPLVWPIVSGCAKSIAKALLWKAMGDMIDDHKACNRIMAECPITGGPVSVDGGPSIDDVSIGKELRNCVLNSIGGKTGIPGMDQLPGEILDFIDGALVSGVDLNYELGWKCEGNKSMTWDIKAKGEFQLEGNGNILTIPFSEEVQSGNCNRPLTRRTVITCCDC
jgi:RHS repeat-associated protein